MKTKSYMIKALFWDTVMPFFTFATIIPAMAYSVSAQIKEMGVRL